MFDIITGGVLSVCDSVVICFGERRKNKKKCHKASVSFILFLTEVIVHEITHVCIFTALKADVLLLFSKDMLSIC